jgi:hypothetical protein
MLEVFIVIKLLALSLRGDKIMELKHLAMSALPFPLTYGIINVCLDPAGLFRSKDIHLC